MFKRRDIPPVLLLLLLIVLVMLTLSQILVVHNGRYGRNIHSIRRLQLELKEMDVNLHTMMLQNVPSIELNRRLLQNKINSRRVAQILVQASQPDLDLLPVRNHSRTTSYAELDPYNATASAVNRSTDEYSDAVTTARYGADVRRTAGGNANKSVNLNLARKRLRATMLNQVMLSSANKSVTQEDFAALNRTSSATRPPVTAVWNSSVSSTNRTSTEEEWNNTNATSQSVYCPAIPPGLRGRIFIMMEHKHDYTEADIIRQNPALLPGGVGRPRDCTARHRVAVIVPYRDRQQHLNILLSHLHPMLQRQQLDYRIYVVEQYGEHTFNKARIMNIAFVEALKQYAFQCFVFHDVDLIPEDDRNMYSCPPQPRHMSVAIDEMGYKLAYEELVGGVLNMRTEHFQRVNGYSNLYWGWGAEDDDMAYRIMYVGLKITRPPDNVARYKMIRHTKRKPSDWRKRTKLLYTGTRRFQFDGLNSLQYRMVHVANTALYTHILVDIGKPPRGF